MWLGYEARKDGVAWSDILVLHRLLRDEKSVQNSSVALWYIDGHIPT